MSANNPRLKQASHVLFVAVAGGAALAAAAALVAATPDQRPVANPTSIVLAAHAGNGRIDQRIARMQEALRAAPGAPRSLERLGWAFVEKARTDADPGFYLLAEKCATLLRDAEPEGAASMLLEGHVQHAMHRFAAAEAVARRLVRARGLPVDHALLGDVLLDRGKLAGAERHYQRLMDRKPGAGAYLRAAELRRRTGDLAGAVEAAVVALEAIGRANPAEYARIASRLADHLMEDGRPAAALRVAVNAIDAHPDSPVAVAARGRALLAMGHYAGAVDALARAVERVPAPLDLWRLAEAEEALGRLDRSAFHRARIEREGELFDPRATSLYLASMARMASEGPAARGAVHALELARRELESRRDLYTLDVYAWAQARTGDVKGARATMAEALARGSSEGRLLYHAGVIAQDAGAVDEARRWLDQAYERRTALLPSERERLNDRRCRLNAAAC